MDTSFSECERCGNFAELYHNDSQGLAFCEDCDRQQDDEDRADAAMQRPTFTLDTIELGKFGQDIESGKIRASVLISALRVTLDEGLLMEYEDTDTLYCAINAVEDQISERMPADDRRS